MWRSGMIFSTVYIISLMTQGDNYPNVYSEKKAFYVLLVGLLGLVTRLARVFLCSYVLAMYCIRP